MYYRFADHINTTFHPDRINGIIDYYYENIQDEMDEHRQRWGYSPTSLSRIESWKEFAQKRPDYQRQHIIENFGLTGTAVLTLNTNPAKGTIKINTIEINEETPGVANPGSWSGVYFKGIPVRITAIPKDGYKFTGWLETGQREPEITLVLNEDQTLTATFARE